MKPIIPVIAIFVLFPACDEVVNVQNRAPFISRIDVCRKDGQVFWHVQLNDPEENPTDIAVILDEPSKADGIITTGPRAAIAPGSDGVGLVGLTTSEGNHTHKIQWAYCKTDGAECALTAAIIDLTDSESCACIGEEFKANTTPPLTVLLQDREDSISELRFPEGIPVTDQCP